MPFTKQPQSSILCRIDADKGDSLKELTRFLFEQLWEIDENGDPLKLSDEDYDIQISILDEKDWSDSNFAIVNLQEDITATSFMFAERAQVPSKRYLYFVTVGKIGNSGFYFVLISPYLKGIFKPPVRFPSESAINQVKSAIGKYIAQLG